MRRVVLAVLVTVLAGCDAVPVATDKAIPIDTQFVLDRTLLQPTEVRAAVIVKRDFGSMGGRCRVRVSLDGKPAVDIATGEKASLQLPLGRHILSADTTGWCGGGMTETTVDVQPGLVLRVTVLPTGTPMIAPTAF